VAAGRIPGVAPAAVPPAAATEADEEEDGRGEEASGGTDHGGGTVASKPGAANAPPHGALAPTEAGLAEATSRRVAAPDVAAVTTLLLGCRKLQGEAAAALVGRHAALYSRKSLQGHLSDYNAISAMLQCGASGGPAVRAFLGEVLAAAGEGEKETAVPDADVEERVEKKKKRRGVRGRAKKRAAEARAAAEAQADAAGGNGERAAKKRTLAAPPPKSIAAVSPGAAAIGSWTNEELDVLEAAVKKVQGAGSALDKKAWKKIGAKLNKDAEESMDLWYLYAQR
jgi:hypothetical protein